MPACAPDGGLSPWRCRARASSILLVALLHEPSSVRQTNGTTRHAHAVSPPSVAVFEEAPELLRAVRPEERAEISRLRVQVTVVDRGPWQPPTPRNAADTHLGLLILDGLVLRRVTLGGRKGAELLGAGDLLQPWRRQMPYETLEAEPGWEVLEPTRLAILDRRFAARISPWPEISAALIARAMDRVRMLAFQHVASHIPGLEGRLLALMWAFADRWGRVTREGVVIPLRLTHATLAELVGASRPSVSTAVARLAREGVLNRTAAGWLLDRSAPHDRGTSPRTNGEANGSANGQAADASAQLLAGAARV
jgi:CRP/FNR family transcriptional regulator, cyclic AMP receptor protein